MKEAGVASDLETGLVPPCSGNSATDLLKSVFPAHVFSGCLAYKSNPMQVMVKSVSQLLQNLLRPPVVSADLKTNQRTNPAHSSLPLPPACLPSADLSSSRSFLLHSTPLS